MLRVNELVAAIKMNQSLGLDPISSGSDEESLSFASSFDQRQLRRAPTYVDTESQEIKNEKRGIRESLLSLLAARNEKIMDEPF